jgi:hypothetical protein
MKKKNMAGKAGKLRLSKSTLSNLSNEKMKRLHGGELDGTNLCGNTGGLSIGAGPCSAKPPETKTFCGITCN